MRYGICPLSVVPVRSSSAHRSEMTSQLLFGELVEILEEKGRQWLRVRCDPDNFIGWVETSQIKPITPTEYKQFRQNYAVSLELVQPVMGPNHFVPVTIGARLPLFDGIRFSVGDTTYTFSGQALSAGDFVPSADFAQKVAKRYLNTPFLSGGRSPFGIDSAGFVQLVYQISGLPLPREAADQLHVGETIDFIEHSRPGDLAFFENRAGRITHAGILMPDNKVIHAYGSVRMDLVDHYGIYDEERQMYTRRLRLIKRVLPTLSTSQNRSTAEAGTSIHQLSLGIE